MHGAIKRMHQQEMVRDTTMRDVLSLPSHARTASKTGMFFPVSGDNCLVGMFYKFSHSKEKEKCYPLVRENFKF